MKAMIFIRSLLFSFGAIFVTIPLSFCFLILWLLPNRRKNFDTFSALWGTLMLWTLKITTGIKSNIVGYDKLDKNKSYIIIGKHESTWETLVMHTFMRPTPVFILKRELLFVPFIGWCLASASNIAIDRGGGVSSIKKILKEGKKFIQEGRNIIIFPQGTRVLPDADIKDYPYKAGFIALIREIGADVVPMALNSGNLWRKKQFLKYPGTITMEFMEPIKYEKIKSMDKNELILSLENAIEGKSKELSKINIRSLD
jgi:1-acyl-sn-glycerol-3-phosphate acyltransferase